MLFLDERVTRAGMRPCGAVSTAPCRSHLLLPGAGPAVAPQVGHGYKCSLFATRDAVGGQSRRSCEGALVSV